MTVAVHIAPLDLGREGLARAYAVLGAEERARADSFAHDDSRRRFVAARGALRFLLGSALGRDPADLAFGTGPFGKPCLRDDANPPALEFSLSHAAGLLAVAWSQEREVGIDIERPRARLARDLDAVAAHALSGGERARLRRLAPAARAGAFYRLWTRKEALAKACGRGFSVPPAAIPGAARSWRGFSLRDLSLPPGFVGALAVERASSS